MAPRAKAKEGFKPIAGTDADEVECLQAAAAELTLFSKVQNPEAVCAAVISRWIIERMKRTVKGRLTADVVFDLNEAKLRGMVEGTLAQVGGAVAAAGVPSDVAFFDLSKEQVVDVLMAACIGYREAAIAAGEDPNFPFSDPIPFGGPATMTADQAEETPPWEAEAGSA